MGRAAYARGDVQFEAIARARSFASSWIHLSKVGLEKLKTK